MSPETHDRHLEPNPSPGALEPSPDDVAERGQLLPEEASAGSADPTAQAQAVLAESLERTEDPDPEASTQSSRRRSEDTV